MTEELDILKIVSDNPTISQRRISKEIGISLGQVNFIIKKCVKKGLIKIEGQTTKSIKYNLTPKGMAEKAALTAQYIKVSYAAVIALTDRIRCLAKEYEPEGKKIYVLGVEDEVMGITKLALGNIDLISEDVENAVIFYWDIVLLENKKKEVKMDNCEWINILE